MKNKIFELNAYITYDGETLENSVTIDGNASPLPIVSLFAEIIPEALRDDKTMMLWLCLLLMAGKRPDVDAKEILKIDLPDLRFFRQPDEEDAEK